MKPGTVYVNPRGRSRSVPKDLRTIIDPRISIIAVEDPWQWRRTDQGRSSFDFYITRANLHHLTESAAADIGALVVCLPKAGEWLAAKVHDMVAAGDDVWIYQPGKIGDRP